MGNVVSSARTGAALLALSNGLTEALARLRDLVAALPPPAGEVGDSGAWRPGELPPGPRCEVHRVHLHETGCILCNGAPVDGSRGPAPHRSPGPR